jgi:zinc transport system ATP-binding protein
VIELKSVSFNYEGKKILDNVSLSLSQEKCYAIIGPNGGGKTTFLHLLMGFLTPSKGEILINGVSPIHFRKEIGYVPQTPSFDRLFPLTVEQLVLMGALQKLTPFGTWPAAVKEKARKALALVGLSHKAKEPIGELSGGQIQRAYIARSIMNQPKLLLLDEPTASLDPEVVKEIIDLLNYLKKEMMILVVSHDLESVMGVADQVICVQTQVNIMEVREVCHHFSIGVYHQLKGTAKP